MVNSSELNYRLRGTVPAFRGQEENVNELHDYPPELG
jgi:hypothetical protein